MKLTREILIAGAAVAVTGIVLLVAVGGLLNGWNLERTEHRVRLGSDDLAVVPPTAATGPLVEALAGGPEANPWNPATGVKVGPRVDLPPPPPVPLPPPPFLPVPSP